jgi:cytochrome c biogenesis protein CcmG/thiol:disulfide interchange protein DsbE
MIKSFVIVLTLMIGGFGCSHEISDSETNDFKVVPVSNRLTGEQIAPKFILYTLDGNEVKLDDYKGKIVILDFWATWCPPCIKGIPDLVSIQSEFINDVVVIGISLDQPSTRDDLRPFIDKYKINYPIVMGTTEVVVAYGNIQAIPTSFVIDREGKILSKHIGLVPKSTIVQEINSLIGDN